MKEYFFPLRDLVQAMKSSAMVDSSTFGLHSHKFSNRDWRKLGEIVLRELFIRDKGPWRADVSGEEKPRVYIESEHFTHDVRLYVDGDFTCLTQKLGHAASIARQLNSPFVDQRLWAGKEWQPVILAPRGRQLLLTRVEKQPDGSLPPRALGMFKGGNRDDRDRWIIDGNPEWLPTHWMELPEPPISEEQDV